MDSRTKAKSFKRQVMKEQRIKRERQQRFALIATVGVIALVLAGFLIYPTLKPAGEIIRPTVGTPPQANFNSMGNPDAPVKMIEFSDYQCPYCKIFHDESQQQIIDNYVATGKVYFTYVPFGPSGSYIGPESKSAAMAAFCAADQGKFWEYSQYLFANHTGENVGDFTDKRLEAFADALGLDTGNFRSCYNANKYSDKLEEGIALGRQNNIGGTPSFLVNGKVIEGAVPYTTFQAEIEAALATAGN